MALWMWSVEVLISAGLRSEEGATLAAGAGSGRGQDGGRPPTLPGEATKEREREIMKRREKQKKEYAAFASPWNILETAQREREGDRESWRGRRREGKREGEEKRKSLA